MTLQKLALSCFIPCYLALWSLIAQENLYSASDSLSISEISVEEMQLYQADFFPFSLAEKGRQSAPGWRGMPPGFLDYQYEQIPLYNPLWGYWDNQHIPLELIRNRQISFNGLSYKLIPLKVKESDLPVTRIAYSQDFQFGFSYLDAALTAFYRPKSYFKLSGNNILRDGSVGDLSRFQVNTYRAQFHHHFSDRWNIDLFYWQIRHKFVLTSFPIISDVFHFHRIGQVFWSQLNMHPDSTQKLVLTPYGYKWGDRYRNNDYTEQRKTEEYSLGIKGAYYKSFQKTDFEVWGDIVRHDITEAFVFTNRELWNGRTGTKLRRKFKNSWVEVTGGYHHISGIPGGLEFSGSWGIKPVNFLSSKISVYQSPRRLSLAALNWNGYEITGLKNPKLPLGQGVSWKLTLEMGTKTVLDIEPYYNNFKSALAYQVNDSLFFQENYDNSGILLSFRTKLWLFELQNDFSYNDNYQQSFIPQVNNVAKLNLHLNLLGGALILDNYVIYHFIGLWRKLDYIPLVNQYVRTNQEVGNYHLLDVKILGHIKTATVFLIWENLASQDYALVDNYFEVYRLFRFGVYWTLFD